jgi:GT2 family glycosyltransferase
VRKQFPSVRIIVNKRNLGFAKGNNIGIDAAKGHAKAILRSKLDAIRGIPKMLAKRSGRQVDESEIGRFVCTWARIRPLPAIPTDNIK